jgi:hypothetical protein
MPGAPFDPHQEMLPIGEKDINSNAMVSYYQTLPGKRGLGRIESFITVYSDGFICFQA